MATATRQGFHINSVNEGRYLKAYLAYLADWRQNMPTGIPLRPGRATLIREWASELADTFIGMQDAEEQNDRRARLEAHLANHPNDLQAVRALEKV